MSDKTCEARRAVLVEQAGDARVYNSAGRCISFVPLTIKRRQQRKVIVPKAGSARASGGPDLPLLKLLGKAFHWQRLIDAGDYACGNDLARALQLDPGWVAEVLRLTLLAPDIVEAIVDGNQPRHVYAHLLKGRKGVLPRRWDQQRELLGFARVNEA